MISWQRRLADSTPAASFISARVRFSISGTRSSIFCRSLGVRHVPRYRRPQNRVDVLRAVWQRRVGADRDALHALRAVLRNVKRRLPACDILRRRIAAARAITPSDASGSRCLVIAEAGAEFCVERRDARQRRALRLPLGNRMRSAARAAAVAVPVAADDRQQRLAAQRRAIGGLELTNANLAHAARTPAS